MSRMSPLAFGVALTLHVGDQNQRLRVVERSMDRFAERSVTDNQENDRRFAESAAQRADHEKRLRELERVEHARTATQEALAKQDRKKATGLAAVIATVISAIAAAIAGAIK